MLKYFEYEKPQVSLIALAVNNVSFGGVGFPPTQCECWVG